MPHSRGTRPTGSVRRPAQNQRSQIGSTIWGCPLRKATSQSVMCPRSGRAGSTSQVHDALPKGVARYHKGLARGSAVSVASAFLLISLGCSHDAATSGLGRLELQLAETIPLPNTWTVRRVLALRRGGHVFALHYPARLAWLPDSTAQLRMPSRVIIGVREVGAGGIELVDRTHRAVVEVGPPPEPRITRTVTVSGEKELWAASWTDGHWLVLSGDSAGPPTVYRIEEGGRLRQLSSPNRDIESRFARLSNVGGEILVSETVNPFRAFRLDRGNWQMLSRLVRPRLDLAGSVAMELVDVDGVALQTIVDQTSRRRVVRVFSPRSGVGHSTVIDAPFVFQGLDAHGRIMGLRTAEREELAFYSWRWQ